MKQRIFLKNLFGILFFIFSITLYSQSKIDTFYYNNNLTAVSPEKASIIAVAIQKDSKIGRIFSSRAKKREKDWFCANYGCSS